MDQTEKKRVLIVDGIALTRFAMRSIIDTHPLTEVFDEARDVPEARRLCAEGKPDVIVLDLNLPRGDGLDLLRELRTLHPPVRVVVVSEEEDLTIVRRAFRSGASGYVSKLDDLDELNSSLENVLQGRLYASRRVSEGLLEELTDRDMERRGKEVDTLSNRELHIFRLIGSKIGATAIARELGITVKTVETHQLRIKQKLKVRSCEELRRKAEAWTGNAHERMQPDPRHMRPANGLRPGMGQFTAHAMACRVS